MMNEPTRSKVPVLDSLARAIRIVTVPPLMVAVILFVLYALHDTMFLSPSHLVFSELFLAVVPLLAYPLSYMIPAIRKKGRNGQRSLAMYLSAVGYLSVVAYGIFAGCAESLRTIQLTYLLSVLLLLFLNKVLRVRASGHACSVSGPILLLCLYVGIGGVIVGLLLYTAIFWASVRMRHHTPKEFLIGSVTPIVAYILSYLFYMIV
ncbi:MAG: hypothetical protein J6B77_07025 [Clostridia bacterium]|nr:hypothetical protein [Clostridia bacterium]